MLAAAPGYDKAFSLGGITFDPQKKCTYDEATQTIGGNPVKGLVAVYNALGHEFLPSEVLLVTSMIVAKEDSGRL